MTRYSVTAKGGLTHNGEAVESPSYIEHTRLQIEHLAPHIVTLILPKGQSVNILVVYSCHCWSERLENEVQGKQMVIMDGVRPRVFCPDRFSQSKELRELLAGLG